MIYSDVIHMVQYYVILIVFINYHCY